MAQWIGFGSGLTHQTKVEDLEDSMRKAVAALKAASESDAGAKWNSVHHLADRLLAARLKALGARISELREPRARPADEQIWRRLQAERERIRQAGVNGVLTEFGCERSE